MKYKPGKAIKGIKSIVVPLALAGIFFTSCSHPEFEVKDFQPMANKEFAGQNSVALNLDYTGAIKNGFVIPSVRQTSGGMFVFHFDVKNLSGNTQKFYYKIYYQGESYKFTETWLLNRQIAENPYASENFYGSWEDSATGFKNTSAIPADNAFHTITDSFRIVGNPRNERKYYGPDESIFVTKADIKDKIEAIKNNPEWLKLITDKAEKMHHTLDEQLYIEAKWTANADNQKNIINNRWERNPRVGKYSFILVVTTEKVHTEKKIPDYISDISKSFENRFINPYYYYLYGDGRKVNGAVVVTSPDTLKVIAKPDLGKGLYIKPTDFGEEAMNTTYFRKNCGSSSELYFDAPFRQYLNEADTNAKMGNVPIVADVEGDAYTVSDYKRNSFSDSQLMQTSIKVARCPCETVNSDSAKHLITLTAPASPKGEYRKESVGVKSRNGFTYGKYYFKVKMPSLLNKSKLWNGLTNAIWLIYQSDMPWNNRRYSASGYIPKSDNSLPPVRKQELSYSEIDFEILKAPHFWPRTSYPLNAKVIPHEVPTDSENIMVTTTNWDMANRDVERFTRGVDSIYYQGKYYSMHRWDDNYKAITGKTPESNNELFNQAYYWFEIDWEPTEIIWSIGPEKDKMRVISYINSTISSIPNNQMLITFTQEYHFSKWWPGLPFLQEKIPFPAKDAIGTIYEIDIE